MRYRGEKRYMSRYRSQQKRSRVRERTDAFTLVRRHASHS